MGVGIAVIKTLQPYIHNIMTVTGTVIAVDFFFPSNQKVRIVSIYLPSTNKTLNKDTQKKVIEWTQQAVARNYKMI